MGVISWLAERFGRGETKGAIDGSTAIDATALTWEGLYGTPSSKAGVTVSINTALRVSTVLACVRVLSEDVAKVPLKLYRERADGGKDPAKDHPLYRILWRRPNSWQTSMEFREQMMLHALLDRGAFAYISRNSLGEVLELIPLLPGSVIPHQDPRTREVTYAVTFPDGTDSRRLPRSSVLTFRGPSWNGYIGLQVFQQAREAIGLSIAIEEQQERLYANGARPGGALVPDGTGPALTKEQIDRLSEQWKATHAGVEKWGKTAVLPVNMKYLSLSQTSVESQTFEARRHQIEEICRAFRVFPMAIGHMDKTSTYASAEAFFAAHVVHSVTPWVERWEQAISRDLLTDEEAMGGYFAKHALAGLLRGDTAARVAYYKAGINDGWLTRNEARGLEDFNPIEGLDVPLMPLNMTDGMDDPDAQNDATEGSGDGATAPGEDPAAPGASLGPAA